LLYLKNKLPFPVFFEASLIEWKIVSPPVVMSTSFTSFLWLSFFAQFSCLLQQTFLFDYFKHLFVCARPLVLVFNNNTSIIAGLVIFWSISIYIMINFSLT